MQCISRSPKGNHRLIYISFTQVQVPRWVHNSFLTESFTPRALAPFETSHGGNSSICLALPWLLHFFFPSQVQGEFLLGTGSTDSSTWHISKAVLLIRRPCTLIWRMRRTRTSTCVKWKKYVNSVAGPRKKLLFPSALWKLKRQPVSLWVPDEYPATIKIMKAKTWMEKTMSALVVDCTALVTIGKTISTKVRQRFLFAHLKYLLI